MTTSKKKLHCKNQHNCTVMSTRWAMCAMLSVCLLAGCQTTSTSFETSVPLTLAGVEKADPNTPAPDPVDPLDVLIAVEKVASKAKLLPYADEDDAASLLDIADSDLSDDTAAGIINQTEWKHPDLPVYLTVTRKSEEILILLNRIPDPDDKTETQAVKLYRMIEKQLSDSLVNYEPTIR